MGYYRPQGDYYAGYRGDPGIGSFFLGLAKKAVGFIPGVGPALSAVMPGGARTVAAGGITAAAKGVAGRGMGAIVWHPGPPAAGPAGGLGGRMRAQGGPLLARPGGPAPTG